MRWWLLLAWGLSAVSFAETVTLRFDWPAALRAEVSFTETREHVTGDSRERRRVSGSYTLTTERVADGLLVRVGEMQTDAADADDGRVQALVNRLSSALPDHVVDDNGFVTRVVGTQRLLDALRATLDAAVAEQPEAVRGRISRALNAALTAERLEATVRSHWSRDVGAWSGLIVEPGKSYEGDARVPVPLLPGEGVTAMVRYRLAEHVACPPPASARDCVVLEMRTFVSGEQAAKVIGRLAESISARVGRRIEVDALEVDNRVRLVTEPQTLLPHAVEVERRTSLSIATDGGKPREMSQSEARSIAYRYVPAAAPEGS